VFSAGLRNEEDQSLIALGRKAEDRSGSQVITGGRKGKGKFCWRSTYREKKEGTSFSISKKGWGGQRGRERSNWGRKDV